MNERQLNEMLLSAFPELKKELLDYTSWQEGMDTGAFLTFEDVFRPHIECAIQTEDEGFLKRVGNFIEDLYLSGDAYAMNVINVGILEGLKANCDTEAVRSILMPATRKAFDNINY